MHGTICISVGIIICWNLHFSFFLSVFVVCFRQRSFVAFIFPSNRSGLRKNTCYFPFHCDLKFAWCQLNSHFYVYHEIRATVVAEFPKKKKNGSWCLWQKEEQRTNSMLNGSAIIIYDPYTQHVSSVFVCLWIENQCKIKRSMLGEWKCECKPNLWYV